MRTSREGYELKGISILCAAIFMNAAIAADPPAPVPPAVAPMVPGSPIPWPEWLFPIDPKSLEKNPKPVKLDDVEQLEIPDSKLKFTQARINDPFNPPDWRPDHSPAPDVVAKGRKPNVMACAYCHTPTGQGRPENSALAGLPEAYFKEQLHDLRGGARKPAGPEQYLPTWNMLKIARAMTDEEIDESAKYFAQQKLRRRVYVIESLRIPRAERAAWIYEEVGGTEDLEGRLLEVTNELSRHERRDDRLEYMAYVPPGSINRGKRLATTGKGPDGSSPNAQETSREATTRQATNVDIEKTVVCATCHGPKLMGTDKIPPIAGRQPTYLLRQLLAFRNGTRTGEAADQMKPVVDKLTLNEMIDMVAYVSSLYPDPR
ncbi:MAG TPA: c-type cytochrome [Steroidobacteraceae bacterium]|nr:c-type cytochrome [Steroidobacteraceae bacterium]